MSWHIRPEPEELLSRAALFRVLALCFAYPEEGLKGRVARELIALRNRNRHSGKLLSTSLLCAWRETDDAGLAAEYVRLFCGSGPCSLHETSYGDGRRMNGRPVELADISGFYSAFGLQPSTDNPDLPDSLTTELEFYSLLLVKLAYAITHNLHDPRRVTERAIALFLEQHLGRWAGAFANAVLEHARVPAFRESARAVRAAVVQECERWRARPLPVEGRMPFDEMQADEFICPREGAQETQI